MVVVKIVGGLGNQMFQYALGRALSEIHGAELKLDISEFEKKSARCFGLKNLNVHFEVATEEDISAILKNNKRIKLFDRLKPYYRQAIITERTFDFDPNILKAPDDVYLDGYWQSEKYFSSIENSLRTELKVSCVPEGKNKIIAEEIKNCNSVSLHVRRGDYVEDDHINKVHGTCPVAYYEECMQIISSKIPDPVFFVFSDDMEWVRRNIKSAYPMYHIDHNSEDNKDYEDLRLMSLCRYNIIANSSFSWWAAWLNENPEKIVCSPGKWANDERLNTRHRIPEGWLII